MVRHENYKIFVALIIIAIAIIVLDNSQIAYSEDDHQDLEKLKSLYEDQNYKGVIDFASILINSNRVTIYNGVRDILKKLLKYTKFKESAQKLIAESYFREAKYYQNQNRYQEAIEAYQKLLDPEQNPKNLHLVEAKIGIADCYFKGQNWEQAISAYQRVINEQPDETAYIPYATSQIGGAYYQTEDYQEAINAYQKLLDPEQNPKNLHLVEAKIGIADCYFKLQNWTESIKWYQRLINEHPDAKDIPYSTFQVGEAYYQQKDYENSLAWYQKVLDNYPDDAIALPALYGAIWSLIELGRYDEVQAVSKKIIDELRKKNFDIQAAEIQMKLGDIQFEMKDYREAAAEYKKVWDDYPDLPKSFTLKLKSKFQEGICYFNAAKPPGYNETDQNAVFNDALLQRAVAAYKQAIDKFGDNYNPQSYENFDFDERLQYVERCQMNLALAYEKLKDYQSARRKYQEVLANPDISTDSKNLARIKLADLQFTDEQYAEAAVSYEQIVATNPKGEYANYAQYKVGDCYFRIEDENGNKSPENLNKSIAAFEQLITDYPNSPYLAGAYHTTALAHKELAGQGDSAQWEEVIRVADEAIEKFEDSQEEDVLKSINEINLLSIKALETLKKQSSSKTYNDEIEETLRDVVNSQVSSENQKAVARLKLGDLLYEEKRYQEAIDEYSQIAQANEVLTAKVQIAMCYIQIVQTAQDEQEKQQHYQEAVESAELALQHENVDVLIIIGAYYALGLAKAGLNDNAGAIEAFERVSSFETGAPDDKRPVIYDSHARLAELYQDQGQHELAIEQYEYIIQHSQDDNEKAATFYQIGLIYEKIGRIQEALNAFENYLNIPVEKDEKEIIDVYKRRANLFIKLNQLDNAIAEAEHASDIVFRSSNISLSQKIYAYYLVGFLYQQRAKRNGDSRDYNNAMIKYHQVYQILTSHPLDDLRRLEREIRKCISEALFNGATAADHIGSPLYIDFLELFLKYFDERLFQNVDNIDNKLQEVLKALYVWYYEKNNKVKMQEIWNRLTPESRREVEEIIGIIEGNEHLTNGYNCMNQANEAFNNGLYHDAIGYYKKAIEEFSKVVKSSGIEKEKLDAARKSMENAQAAILYIQCENANSDAFEQYKRWLREFVIPLYEKLINDYKDSQDLVRAAHFKLAGIYYTMQDWDSAEVHYKKVAENGEQDELTKEAKKKIQDIQNRR